MISTASKATIEFDTPEEKTMIVRDARNDLSGNLFSAIVSPVMSAVCLTKLYLRLTTSILQEVAFRKRAGSVKDSARCIALSMLQSVQF